MVEIDVICVGDRTWLDSSAGMKCIWLLRGWYKFTCYSCAGRKSLVFSISMKNDSFFLWVVQIDLISVRGIEFDVITS